MKPTMKPTTKPTLQVRTRTGTAKEAMMPAPRLQPVPPTRALVMRCVRMRRRRARGASARGSARAPVRAGTRRSEPPTRVARGHRPHPSSDGPVRATPCARQPPLGLRRLPLPASPPPDPRRPPLGFRPAHAPPRPLPSRLRGPDPSPVPSRAPARPEMDGARSGGGPRATEVRRGRAGVRCGAATTAARASWWRHPLRGLGRGRGRRRLARALGEHWPSCPRGGSPPAAPGPRARTGRPSHPARSEEAEASQKATTRFSHTKANELTRSRGTNLDELEGLPDLVPELGEDVAVEDLRLERVEPLRRAPRAGIARDDEPTTQSIVSGCSRGGGVCIHGSLGPAGGTHRLIAGDEVRVAISPLSDPFRARHHASLLRVPRAPPRCHPRVHGLRQGGPPRGAWRLRTTARMSVEIHVGANSIPSSLLRPSLPPQPPQRPLVHRTPLSASVSR